ncbi:hypothetical protein O3M35_008422 [Rhynocoris fuscipes]|uniref:Uncharacterized protein n=1 Tax=Rhynocoris fuscipes TaxID=488301 RepID=A0AAW1DDM6_9HEMI
MHPFHRRRNCNGNEDIGKGNGGCRQRNLMRNDQGEPMLQFDDKFDYIQKEPSVYQLNKVDSTLTEKEKVLMASIKDNKQISPSSGTMQENQNSTGPIRSLTTERSTL